MQRNDADNFYCYSWRMFHFISAFGEKCYASKLNQNTNTRYWVFKKSARLDEIITEYNKIKHKF